MEPIKITREIKDDVIESIIITALEGGSNYWYFLPMQTTGQIRNLIPRTEEASLSRAFALALLKGAELEVHDIEEEGCCLGIVSRKTMQERLQSLSEDEGYAHALEEEINGNGDAGTSDIVFQYLVMNKIVFA
jgi:hypothetical protein